MWRHTRRSPVLLSVLFTVCSLTEGWRSKVLKVTVSRGEDAVLPCSLSNPGPQLFSKDIHVQWVARDPGQPSFFSCFIRQQSTLQDLSDCLIPLGKFSLTDDVQHGNFSLRIRNTLFQDNGKYYCKVDIQGKKKQEEIELHVEAQPQILSLSVEETSTNQNATRWLKCEAEGNPKPEIVWLMSTRMKSEKKGTVSTPGPYQVVSSVPYPEDGEELTCRAENALGHVERTHLTNHTLLIPLAACGAIFLLLLLSAGVTLYCRRRKASDVTADESDVVYENSGREGVQDHRLPTSNSRNLESLTYSMVTASHSASSPPVNFQNHQAGVVYCSVNMQH